MGLAPRLTTVTNDLRNLEKSWAAGDAHVADRYFTRYRRVIAWWIFTVLLVLTWFAEWCGGGAALGSALQKLYGVDPLVAPLWLRADAHLHATVALTTTLWAAWAGRIFTPIGSWLGPPVAALVVIVDELVQLGQADRSFEWGDEIAGAVGITVAIVILLMVHTSRPRLR